MSTDSATIKTRSVTLRLIWLLTCVVLLMLCGSSLLSLLAPLHWFADLLANLRIQQVIAIVTALLICLFYRSRVGSIVALILLVTHGVWFSAAIPINSPTLAPVSPITITFSNVLTSNQRHEDVIADLISRDPDVISVAELSSSLAEKLQSELAATYPFSILRPQDLGNFGIGLLSKSPLRASEVFFAGETEIESIAATVSINGNDYRVYATHPLPPMGAHGFASRNEHLQGIAKHIRGFRAANVGTSIVLVGDLNLTPWSPLFGKFQQESGLRRAGERFDLRPTWYRFNSFPFGLMLDHGLISSDLNCVSHTVGPSTGSDHRSVTIQVAKLTSH